MNAQPGTLGYSLSRPDLDGIQTTPEQRDFSFIATWNFRGTADNYKRESIDSMLLFNTIDIAAVEELKCYVIGCLSETRRGGAILLRKDCNDRSWQTD